MSAPSNEELERLKDGGWREWQAIEAALERGEIDEAGWHRATAAIVVPAYLAGDNPRAQSGHSGDEARWESARRLLLDAIQRDCTFLDVGCANGHLMECVHAWGADVGIRIEPWGLEISPDLAELARARLPQWRKRIVVGNALDWHTTRRFDVVRTNLDYVPRRRRPDLVRHLLADAVAPGGRLVIGVFNEETDAPTTEGFVQEWGYRIAGSVERPHPDTSLLVRRALWIDAADA